MKYFSVLECVLLGLLLSNAAGAQTNDFSGQTSNSIRNVLTLVANHQLRPIADGAYPVCYTIKGARAAAKPVGLEWDYPWGLDLYGLLRAGEATGDTNINNFMLNHNLIVARYCSWLVGLQSTCTNSAGAPQNLASFYNGTALRDFFTPYGPGKFDPGGSMTSAILEGALQQAAGPAPEQVQVAGRMSDYITHVQRRLPDDTFFRPGWGNTIWADDLYMSCPFLTRWYEFTGDTNLLDDAARQIINMAGYLQDTNGFWFHGYFVGSRRVNGFKWGRANGWAMLATTEVLSVMPTNHPAFTILLDILRRHIAAVAAVQQPSGMWRQILDYDNRANWEETSCTAMFAYCIARAVNRGWIEPSNISLARNAFVGICKKITPAGGINGTCQLTLIGTSASYYLKRARPPNDMHGRGPVMLAGAEILSSDAGAVILPAN
jgi:unsaturated rhamnogalacturonyl hydrolase